VINITPKVFSNEDTTRALDVINKMAVSREQADVDIKPLVENLTTMTNNEKIIAQTLINLITRLRDA
jgi:hypothetical protein